MTIFADLLPEKSATLRILHADHMATFQITYCSIQRVDITFGIDHSNLGTIVKLNVNFHI